MGRWDKNSVQVPFEERRDHKCSHVAAKDVPGRAIEGARRWDKWTDRDRRKHPV